MRKIVSFAFLLTAAFLLLACGEQDGNGNAANRPANTGNDTSKAAVDTKAAEADVRKMMDDFAAALNKNDADAVGAFYVDDYTLIDGNGQIQTKASRTEQIKTGKIKWEGLKFDDMKVSMHPTGDAAVVTARATAKTTADGKTAEASSMVTWIVVKGADGWKFSRAQITDIKGGS
jgi:ketosteroid isomerase-like protein